MTTEISSASLTQAAKNSAPIVSLSRSQSQGDPKAIRAFAIELSRLSSELKCEQVVLIDVRGRNQLCEYLVIVSGTSDRQMKSVSDQLKAYGAQHGSPRWKRDRDTNGTWIAADFVDVVVHLFEPGQRAWYDLEGMWADAPRVEWRRNTPAKSANEAVFSAKTAEQKFPLEMIAVVEAMPKKVAASKPAAQKVSGMKVPGMKVPGMKVPGKKPTAKKTATKNVASKKVSSKKPTAKKVSSKKVSSKKPIAKKTATKKVSSKKPTAKNVASKKPTAMKVANKKLTAMKVSSKKVSAKKKSAKKSSSR